MDSSSDFNRKRKPSEILKRGYSNKEVEDIYSLGKLFIVNASFEKAIKIYRGLSLLAPDFIPAHLALAYCLLAESEGQHSVLKKASLVTKQALRIDPRNQSALILHVAILLSLNDYKSAGSYLGELDEQSQKLEDNSSELYRIYKSQLARFKKLSSSQRGQKRLQN